MKVAPGEGVHSRLFGGSERVYRGLHGELLLEGPQGSQHGAQRAHQQQGSLSEVPSLLEILHELPLLHC